MLPNVKTTRETLNVPALPLTAGMELDYRTDILGPSKRRRLTLDHLVAAAVAAVVVTLAVRFVGSYTITFPFLFAMVLVALANVVLTRAGYSFFFGASIVAALVFFAGPTHELLMPALIVLVLASCWLWNLICALTPAPYSMIVFGPLLWLLCVAGNTSFFAVFLVAATIAVLFQAEALTRHFALWMNANPHLTRRMRRRWLAVWRPIRSLDDGRKLLHSMVHPRVCRQPMLAAELAERTRYLVGYPVVIVFCLATVVVYVVAHDPLTHGTLAFAVLIVLLATYGTANVLTYSASARPGLALKLLWQAVVRWHTYNVHQTTAPGVFQSPFGHALRRQRMWSVAVAALAVIVLPSAWYFPIGPRLFGVNKWLLDAAQSGMAVHDYFHSSPLTERDLTPAQQRSLQELSPVERQRALRRLADEQDPRTAPARDYRTLLVNPEYTLALHLRALPTGRLTAILNVILSLLACLIAPSLLLFAACWALSARVLLHHHLTLEGEPSRPGLYHARRRLSPWSALVSRLRASRYQTQDELGALCAERDQLLIGFNPLGDYPVFLSPAILAEHGHITGDSGSGKSSRGIAPLVEQLIARGDCSVVILDLKNDRAIFEAARAALNRTNAKRRRGEEPPIPFRWFTNQPEDSTYVFNPFLQQDMRALTPPQRAEILLGALGLNYGEGFGQAFFSSVHRHVFKRVIESNPQFQSFRQIDRFFRDGRFVLHARELGIDRKSREEASHLYTVVESLGSFDALNVREDTRVPPEVRARAIDMGDAVRSPHVIYFGLAAALEQSTVREIAKLALHTLLVAAVHRGHSRHQTYLFIDEFQQIVSHDLEIVLRQARSHGIAVILANQTRSDLRVGDIDITPTVEANTRFRQIFSASDVKHQNALIDASGEAMYELYSWSSSHGYSGSGATHSESVSVHEQIGPRLRRNDIIEATDDPLQSIVQITRGQGFTQYGGMMFPMFSPFHITPEEYQRRRGASWPRREDHPGTIVTPLSPEVFGDPVETPLAPALPLQGADRQALLELETNLDSYPGVPNDDTDRPET